MLKNEFRYFIEEGFKHKLDYFKSDVSVNDNVPPLNEDFLFVEENTISAKDIDNITKRCIKEHKIKERNKRREKAKDEISGFVYLLLIIAAYSIFCYFLRGCSIDSPGKYGPRHTHLITPMTDKNKSCLFVG